MMNQTTDPTHFPAPWRFFRPGARLTLATIAIGALALGVSGCKEKSGGQQGFGKGGAKSGEVAQVDNSAEAAPERKPEAKSDSDSTPGGSPRRNQGDPLQGLTLDERVEFPAINAPSSRSVAESVAALAGAIAQGDAKSLHSMLDKPSQTILDQLVESDAWRLATDSITKVRICSIEEDGQTIRVGLGIENADGAYLLGWEGERVGSGWLYAGIALETPMAAETAAQLDGSSLLARLVPEPGEIIDETFDPTLNDPRRDENNKRRRSKRGGGGGGRRGF